MRAELEGEVTSAWDDAKVPTAGASLAERERPVERLVSLGRRGPRGNRVARLHPFPSGWYCVGHLRDLRGDTPVARTFMGREVVMFRTAEGALRVTDAHCPHLGAHFAHGGVVLPDGTLRCPFHHFRFDGAGACVGTPYGKRLPGGARLRVWPVRALAGFVLVYFDPDGDTPQWEPPALEQEGWLAPPTTVLRLRGHPQETSENSVDSGHFGALHEYEQLEATGEPVVDGPRFSVGYEFVRPRGFMANQKLRAKIEIQLFGLGISVVHTHVESLGLHVRNYVLATPVDGDRIDLHLGLSLLEPASYGSVHPALSWLPRPLVRQLLSRLAFRGLVDDVRQDEPIWTHKAHLHPPGLAEGDGPIGKYRQWARQFYPGGDPYA